jgi:hypothetical protein
MNQTAGSRRALGFLTLLPLYLVIAAAVGFVDHRVRVYGDKAYTEVVPATVDGTAPAPGRYRILAPYAYVHLKTAFHMQPDNAWIVFRWLCLVAAMAAGHLLYRTWFSEGVALGANALVAALLPLTFTNSVGVPDHFIELFLFTLGCACIVRGSVGAFLVVLFLAALNRETSFLLVMVLAVSAPLSRKRLIWIGVAAALWAGVYVGLRWWLGFAAYDPMEIGNNIGRLFTWPGFAWQRDLYYRAFGWFFVALLAAPAVIIARTWSAQPRFVRGAVGIVTPVFVAIGVTFSSVMEPRIFTPLIPLVVTGILFALFTPERVSR